MVTHMKRKFQLYGPKKDLNDSLVSAMIVDNVSTMKYMFMYIYYL